MYVCCAVHLKSQSSLTVGKGRRTGRKRNAATPASVGHTVPRYWHKGVSVVASDSKFVVRLPGVEQSSSVEQTSSTSAPAASQTSGSSALSYRAAAIALDSPFERHDDVKAAVPVRVVRRRLASSQSEIPACLVPAAPNPFSSASTAPMSIVDTNIPDR